MTPEWAFWLFVMLVVVFGSGAAALVASVTMLAHRVGFPFPVSPAHFIYPPPEPPIPPTDPAPEAPPKVNTP